MIRRLTAAATLAVAVMAVAAPTASAVAPHRGATAVVKAKGAALTAARNATARRTVVPTPSTVTVSCPISGIPVEGCTPRGGVFPPPPR